MKTNDHISAPLPLCRGARVRMSPLGRSRHPKYGDREGLIVGQGSPSSWRVKFDDRKTIQAIHQDYLERVPRLGVSHHSAEASADRHCDASNP
ncbi:hypothetical protein LPW26_00375 [Rhodopseudomonas sp. HC1]|uniref:hypothetical protein n=1 Tax=Rhodopseudomonas infernalis TaxID=2897386 RepID=UPI001EE8A24C|nr:hypothetical protein [Rhodopseudomonas infernalis]MCG6203077.1 hypothetical protein [Rhodopseudomonas infernalis]